MFRLAEKKDLPRILEIYEYARQFMIENGNATQWAGGYPKIEMLEDDIKNNQLYVYVENETVHGVFAFIIGEDATYKVIDNGAWLSDSTYGTIHRIASCGKVHGIFTKAIEYCKTLCPHLRIDTHADNFPMQHLIEKNGFKKCGIIYTYDGSPRLAFEMV